MAISYTEDEDVAAYIAKMSTAELLAAQDILIEQQASLLTGRAEANELMKRAKGPQWKPWSERTSAERKEHWLAKAASRPIEWPECGCESLDDHSDMHPETYAHHLRLEHECNKSLEKAVGAKLPCAACASCEDPNCNACLNCRYITQHGFRVEEKDAHLAKAVGAETECLGCANCPDPDCMDCKKCRSWRRKAVFRVQPFDDDPNREGAGI